MRCHNNQAKLLLLLLIIICLARVLYGLSWPTLWGKPEGNMGKPEGNMGKPAASGARSPGAVLELTGGDGLSAEQENVALSKTYLMKQAHAMSASKSSSAAEVSCWQKAYGKLLSSCSQILQQEEKKCRLAFEFTDCFLRMTGWPPTPPCPENRLVRFCTEELDEHVHEIYLAFFVETAAMCRRLQSEAFRKETSDVVNELKQTGHWVLDTMEEVEGLSQQILNDAMKQSERLEEKLTGVQALSEALLTKNEDRNSQLKSTLDVLKAVGRVSDHITTKQKELQELLHTMNQVMITGMQELKDAARQTHQQVHGVSEGYKQLDEQQVRLAESLVDNLHRLKESALQSLDELKESQASAMEETKTSLKGLNEGAQKVQETFDTWRMEMDGTTELLLKGSHAMLDAQEAFVAKQGSILSTLDRMFSLYESILHESRAFKLLAFYAISLLFVFVFTSTKQTYNARVLLYCGLFVSMAMELYLWKAYSGGLKDQQWIQARCCWIRVGYGMFSTTTILYSLVTYRDLTWQSHDLLLKMHRKLSNLANRSQDCAEDYGHGAANPVDEQEEPSAGHFSLQFTAVASSLTQALASKIMRRVHKFIRRPRRRRQDAKTPKIDVLKAWMEGRGLDTSILEQTESSEEDGNDPIYYYSNPNEKMAPHKEYNLRSLCEKRSTCRPRPMNMRVQQVK